MKNIFFKSHWFFNWPVREFDSVTQVPEIVDITEEFALQLWVHYSRYWTVLVQRSGVAL